MLLEILFFAIVTIGRSSDAAAIHWLLQIAIYRRLNDSNFRGSRPLHISNRKSPLFKVFEGLFRKSCRVFGALLVQQTTLGSAVSPAGIAINNSFKRKQLVGAMGNIVTDLETKPFGNYSMFFGIVKRKRLAFRAEPISNISKPPRAATEAIQAPNRLANKTNVVRGSLDALRDGGSRKLRERNLFYQT